MPSTDTPEAVVGISLVLKRHGPLNRLNQRLVSVDIDLMITVDVVPVIRSL